MSWILFTVYGRPTIKHTVPLKELIMAWMWWVPLRCFASVSACQTNSHSVSFVLADHQRTSELSWDLWLFYSTYTRNFDQDMFMITNKNFVVRYLWWIYLQCSCLFTENVAGVVFTQGLQLFNEGEWLSNNHDAVHLWPRLLIYNCFPSPRPHAILMPMATFKVNMMHSLQATPHFYTNESYGLRGSAC